MPRSLVADLSGRTGDLVNTATKPKLVPAPPPLLGSTLINELEAAFARFDGRPETAAAFAAAATPARALVDAAGGGEEAERSAGLSFAADALAAGALGG